MASTPWPTGCPGRPARSRRRTTVRAASPAHARLGGQWDRGHHERERHPRMSERTDLHADIGEILLTEAEIDAKVRELGARISADYAGRRLTLVSVLKGSLPFMADLMRAIDIPVRIDLMEVSSYGGSAT